MQLYRAGHYAEATPLAQEAVAIREKALGPDHPVVATRLNNLAELYQKQGRFAEAESFYRRTLAIREKELGTSHPAVGTTLNNLTELYRAQGRFAEAEPLYQRGLAIDEKALGPDRPDVAIDLYNLASLYKAQGRFAEALALTGRAIGIVSRQIAVASNVRSSTARPPPISAAIKILLDMVRDIEGQGRRWASSKRWYAGHPVPAAISAGEFLQASGGWGQ